MDLGGEPEISDRWGVERRAYGSSDLAQLSSVGPTASAPSFRRFWDPANPISGLRTPVAPRKPQRALIRSWDTAFAVALARGQGFPDCVHGPLAKNAVCDTSKDPITRARGLVAAMTTTELINNTVHMAPGVARLGIPSYDWWSEALHGLSTIHGVAFAASGNFSYATSFPQPIVMSAAFDDALIKTVASTISTEARAFSNAARTGLDWFAPNINPWRDPRWGRGPETPGEDAFRAAQYVYQYIDGFQGGIDPKPYIKNTAVCKHWAGYDIETNRLAFDAIITTQELSEYFMRPFQTCVRDARVNAVMCSYNAVNGVPACASPYLLQDVLVGSYGFSNNSWVASDCDAVANIFDAHGYTDSYPAAAAAAIKAGTNVNCGTTFSLYLQAAIDQGLAERADVENAVVRFLGYFDPPTQQPYRQITWDEVNTPSAQKLAYVAAAEGLVLLKNDGTLPLKKNLKKMAVIGPWANATTQMQGSYFGIAPFLITPIMGASAAGYQVIYVPGMADVLDTSTSGFADAIAAAHAADVVVFVGGIDATVEGEALDRKTIVWTGVQLELIQKLSAVGKPLVVVQCGAGQIDDSSLLSNTGVGAILWAGYPGQSGGAAIFDIISGKVAPAGRLPVTQYPAAFIDQVPITDMNLRPNKTSGNPGRTYQWYTGSPVFEFGFGLHYTTFSVHWQTTPVASYSISNLLKKAGSATHPDLAVFDTFKVNVHNAGSTVSDFVALMFVKTTAGPAPFPNKSLIGYSRVAALKAGWTVATSIGVTLGSIARTDDSGNLWLYPGRYSLSVDVPESLTHDFTLTGQAVQLSHFPAPP
ncbi:unnamed protein product [Mycena citricolor]|uniref:xylan 1,4-beta-xylosidase n=1 Tax=Mycena citricolor TaxID=2018698 RepID=A0AAD2H6Q0_9AGAR|nr:unnamed protein product [Mycena citricolor]